MKRSGKLLDAIGQIDDRYIMEAAEPVPEEETKQPVKKAGTVPLRWRRTAAAFAGLAACAAVAVWTLDQGAAVSPFGAKTEETAAREAAGLSDGATEQQSAAELPDEAAVPQAAAELPDEAAVPQAAAELAEETAPYAYTAEQSPQAAARAVSPEPKTALRSVPEGAQAEMPEAAAAKVFASDIQADESGVTCTLVNEDAENTLIFGEAYYLEYLTEDGWQEIAPIGEVAWESIAYELEPGGSLEKSWDLEIAYGALDGGQYRIGIPCEEQNGDGSVAAVIYVEFGI